jgi:hypothetical protein
MLRGCRALPGLLALAAAAAALGCSSGTVAAPSVSGWNTPAQCGATPGTAGTWRPGVNYCEY